MTTQTHEVQHCAHIAALSIHPFLDAQGLSDGGKLAAQHNSHPNTRLLLLHRPLAAGAPQKPYNLLKVSCTCGRTPDCKRMYYLPPCEDEYDNVCAPPITACQHERDYGGKAQSWSLGGVSANEQNKRSTYIACVNPNVERQTPGPSARKAVRTIHRKTRVDGKVVRRKGGGGGGRWSAPSPPSRSAQEGPCAGGVAGTAA